MEASTLVPEVLHDIIIASYTFFSIVQSLLEEDAHEPHDNVDYEQASLVRPDRARQRQHARQDQADLCATQTPHCPLASGRRLPEDF